MRLSLKLKKSKLLWIIIFMAFIIDTKVSYLVPIGISNMLIVVFGGIIVCPLVSNNVLNIILRDYKRMNQICFITLVSYVAIFIYSLVIYKKQNVLATFYGDNYSFSLLFILLVYPILSYLILEKNIGTLFRMMNFFALLIYIMEIVQPIIYIKSGRIIYTAYFTNDYITVRNNSIRIIMHWVGNVMIVYNFYRVYIRKDGLKSKWKNIVLLITGLYSLLIISQSRMYTLAVGAAIIAIILGEHNTSKNLMKKIVIIVGSILIIIGSGVLGDYLSSFSLSGTRAYSTSARLYAIPYYWNYFCKHPIFGYGFANDNYYYSLLHGNGMAWSNDVGVFGMLVKFGIFVIPLYFMVLYRIIKICKNLWKNPKLSNQLFYTSMVMYLCITTIGQSVLDTERILLWPVIIALFEFLNWVSYRDIAIIEF